MRRAIFLAAMLLGCSGNVEVAESDGCDHDFMRCLSGGDSGSVYSWESDGAYDYCTCEASLGGKPVKLMCAVRHAP